MPCIFSGVELHVILLHIHPVEWEVHLLESNNMSKAGVVPPPVPFSGRA